MFNREREKHPAYGMVSISRVQSNGTILFGSKIKHNDYIKLEITKAEKEKDIYSEHYFPKKTIISVNLSAAQFANMLIQSNTTGVPCTINYIQDEGSIDSLKELKPLKTEMEKDTWEALEKLKERSLKLTDILRHDFKGKVKIAQKEEVKDLSIQISNSINSNLDFLYSRHVNKLEKVGSEIIAEAEARISSLVHETGIQELKKQNLIKDK